MNVSLSLSGLNTWCGEKSGIDFSTELRNFLNKNIHPEQKDSGRLISSEKYDQTGVKFKFYRSHS